MTDKKKTSREEEALKARSEVYERLDEKTKAALAEIEERILGTRT